MNIFSFRYFKSLCLCDLSISCIRTAFLHSHRVFLFILGERTGSLLGIIFLYITDFYISIFSHPSYSCFPCSILSHTVFYWERTVSVCNMTLYSVFVLCVFPPHAFGGLYIWRAIYIWRVISLWMPIFVWRAPRSSAVSSKDWITLTLRYQLRH